jgi:quinol monooxygenase YgiN
MGRISVAAFKAKPGKHEELLAVIADRLPLLRQLGLGTSRAPILMQSRDGTVIQISEWAGDEAIAKAHETPEVLAMWERFAACSNYVKLATLPETHEDFATFEPIAG